MSSTAFGNVAVPHSLVKDTNTSFISIAISEKPIPWGKNEVNIIAMIGVNDDSRKIFAEIFDSLIDILSEPIHVKGLTHCKDFQECMSYILRILENS